MLPCVDCGALGWVVGDVDVDDVEDAGGDGVVLGEVCVVAGWLPPNRLVPLPDRSCTMLVSGRPAASSTPVTLPAITRNRPAAAIAACCQRKARRVPSGASRSARSSAAAFATGALSGCTSENGTATRN